MATPMQSPETLTSGRVHPPNVIIVGETGAGKSSVVNLIAGKDLAKVSSGAEGCTMESASYDASLTDRQGHSYPIRLFDTVGLNEPSLSRTGCLNAIEKAHLLIRQLSRTGGIRLLIFCIRGGRITDTMKNNYHLFCDVLCQNKVPVAFVITGMESEDPMKGWWTRNAAQFKTAELHSDSHVCVTATRGLHDVYESQYGKSQIAIREMLLGHISTGTSWKPGHSTSWFAHLAGVLLGWVMKLMPHRRTPLGRRALTEEELTRFLEDKCGFDHSEALRLASDILAKHEENDEKFLAPL